MTPSTRLSLPGQAAAQAEFVVTNLQHTFYQHKQAIDVDRGVYDCDCNGFIGFVLERSAPDHYALIPKEDTQIRPRAFKYYDFFDSLTPHSTGGWHQINLLKDARRGDIIAWRLLDIEKDHNTGHVMMAAETPTADDSGIFSLRIYDSAEKAHFSDTRGTGEGQFSTGVGTGVIKFKVDDSGKPIAFQFSPAATKFESLPIAIGRLEALPTSTDL